MTTGFLNKTITVHGAEERYVVYVPENYTADTAWPLIVFLHGAGERGDDGVAQTIAGIGPAIKKDPSRFPAIVLMPQCPKEQVWNTRHDSLEAEFEKTLEEFNIDPKRIYLTGLSMGGYGAWLWGALHTDTFAAIMPICGGGDPYDIQKLLNVGGGNPYGSLASACAPSPPCPSGPFMAAPMVWSLPSAPVTWWPPSRRGAETSSTRNMKASGTTPGTKPTRKAKAFPGFCPRKSPSGTSKVGIVPVIVEAVKTT